MEKNSTVGNVGTIKGDGWEEALIDGTLNIYTHTMKQIKIEKISNSKKNLHDDSFMDSYEV